MALDRNMVRHLLAEYGAGPDDFDSIEYIVTTNSDIIRMKWYKREGYGVKWIDEDMGEGNYITGVKLYAKIATSIEDNLDENDARAITFIDVGAIDRIAFKAPIAPDWAYVPLSDNANLKSLSSNGISVEWFDVNTLTYNVVLPNGTTTVPTVTAVADNSAATVQITQASSPRGTAKIVVTAEDETTKTYTIKFSVVVGVNPNLATLTYNGTGVSGFNAKTLDYNVVLPAGTTIIPVVAATSQDPRASVQVIQPSSASGTAQIIATAEDGFTKKIYTINFLVPKSTNANLATLTANGTSVPAFNANTLSYNVVLPNGTTTTPVVAATTQVGSATLQITQPSSTSGTSTVVVTAEDGTTKKTYTINFSVAPSTNANLATLTVGGTGVTGFSANTLNYNVELPFGTAVAPAVAATVAQANATTVITQASSPTGTATVVVTAQDGTTKKTYTVTFTVAVE